MSDPNQPVPPPYGETPQPPLPPPATPPTAPTPYPAPPGPPPAYPAAPQYPAPAYGQPQYPPPPYGQGYDQPPPQYYQQPYHVPEVPYVHWGLRVAGYLLDGVLLLPAYVVAAVGEGIAGDTTLATSTQHVGIALLIFGYVVIFGFSIWNGIVRQGRTGSSLGKQWVGIQVVKEQTGQPIGGWPTFGRGLLHILDALPCYLGFLWPLWDDKRQTFADKIMKTIVVKRPPADAVYPQYPDQGAYQAPPGYGQPG